MKSDQELKFHKGQEFTKKNNSHVHCIIHSYVHGEQAYLVSYTCSGNWKKISEADLVTFYAPSTETEKRFALEHINEKKGRGGDGDENGTSMSPAAQSVNR